MCVCVRVRVFACLCLFNACICRICTYACILHTCTMYTCVHVCTCTHTMYSALYSSLNQSVEYSYKYTNSRQKSCMRIEKCTCNCNVKHLPPKIGQVLCIVRVRHYFKLFIFSLPVPACWAVQREGLESGDRTLSKRM